MVDAEMLVWEMVDREGVWCRGADPRSVIDAFGDQSRGVLCVQVCVVSSQPPLGMLSM